MPTCLPISKRKTKITYLQKPCINVHADRLKGPPLGERSQEQLRRLKGSGSMYEDMFWNIHSHQRGHNPSTQMQEIDNLVHIHTSKYNTAIKTNKPTLYTPFDESC